MQASKRCWVWSIRNLGDAGQSRHGNTVGWNLESAERMGRDSLSTHERVLGKNHPSTLISVSTLADVLRARGNLAEASTLYDRAYNGLVKTRGSAHPTTLTVLYGARVAAQGSAADAAGATHGGGFGLCARIGLPKNHPDAQV